MAEVKILITGYTSQDSDEKTCATISLVKDGNIIMVADPGVVGNQQEIIESLAKEKLTADDVNYVFITHSHLDHYRNIGMFKNAKTLEYWGIWDKNTVIDWNENFTENISIIRTPGHNYDGLTLLVKTDKGIVAIAGDVFWKENFPEIDEYANDMEQLRISRQKVLAAADYIIPGHADIYKVNK